MTFESFIALRYLKPRRGNFFVTLIGAISIAGVMVGVMSIILVLSVLNGFEREVQSRFVGFDAHLKVKDPHDGGFTNGDSLADVIQSQKNVAGLSPYILEKAMITSRSASHVAFIKGTDPVAITHVSEIKKNLVGGDIDFSQHDGSYAGIVIGFSLSLQLDVSSGDTITIISPTGVTGPFSTPSAKRFIIRGIFKTDMFEYDNAYAFISIPDACKLFEHEGEIMGYDIKLTDMDRSFEIRDALAAKLGAGYRVETWYDQHSDLYSAMLIEKWGSMALLSIIIMVAGFNIAGTLIMTVMQRTPEIGILKSIGANESVISGIYMRQGALVGGIGILAGCVFGYGICFLQLHYELIKLPGDIFFLDAVPMELKWIDFLAVISVSFILCILSTVYPARKAAALPPVEALRS